MANIVPSGAAFRVGRACRVRTAASQVTTGQTDWLQVPVWAKYMRVVIDLTATSGTTPIFTPTLVTPSNPGNAHLDDVVTKGVPASGDAIPPTDSVVINLGGAILTSDYTSTGTAIIVVGPGVTGIANDLALGTSGVNHAFINDVLPEFVGIKIVNDRTTGDEHYTYTVDVEFRDR
jgi:hypothetical protein